MSRSMRVYELLCQRGAVLTHLCISVSSHPVQDCTRLFHAQTTCCSDLIEPAAVQASVAVRAHLRVANTRKLAADKDAYAVTQGFSLLHAVGCQHNCCLLLDIPYHIPQQPSRGRVQSWAWKSRDMKPNRRCYHCMQVLITITAVLLWLMHRSHSSRTAAGEQQLYHLQARG